MTPKGHAIPSKTQLLSYGTPAFGLDFFDRLTGWQYVYCQPVSYLKEPRLLN